VNGYTQPSLNDLHTLIVSHGGGFMQYLDGKTTVTHIIASSLTPKKIVDFRRYRIVKPAWVVDSIKAGRLLPWDAYRVVDEGERQKVLRFDDGNVVSQVNVKSKGYREQSDTSWYRSQLPQNLTQAPPPESSSAPIVDGTTSSPSTSFGSHGFDSLKGEDLAAVDRLADEAIEGHVPIEPELVEEQEGTTLSHISPRNIAEDDFAGQDMTDFMILDESAQGPDDSALIERIERADPPGSSTARVRPSTPEPQQIVQVDDDQPADSARTPTLLAQMSAVPTKKSLKRKLPPGPFDGGADRKTSNLTAEEHNTILLADPHIRKSSTINPEFLDQYYRESRLHHLSTWKADLKSQLQALAAEKSASQKARPKRASNARRYIMHVDFDSFFVAVTLKKHPQYKDVPACVAHGGGGGAEIASCNYPARVFGVKNGMWMKRAHELCPELKVLPYDFPEYEAASRHFYDAMMAIEGVIQSVSIDEALIDISATCLEYGGTDGTKISEGNIHREQSKADEIAQTLRAKVKVETGCEVSVGIGGNILLAKVALRKAKPAGQYQLKPEEVLSFLGELEVQSLPGVAWSIGGKLEEAGIKYVKDIRDMSREKLINVLGPKTGEKLWNYARGIDRQEVGDVVVRKSVSAEVNWGVRFETQEQAEEFVDSLCGELNKRLLKEGVKGKQLTMKIMRRAADAPLDPPKHLGHGKCDTFNKSVQLGVATNDKEVLSREALSIMRGYGFSPGELRGLGVQMQKLEPIRALPGGDQASSQRRLQFQTATKPVIDDLPKAVSEPLEPAAQQGEAIEPVADTVPTVDRRLKFKSAPAVPKVDADLVDSIKDDPETPRKTRSSTEFVNSVNNMSDSPSRKPLNILGTQFILPTQVDPAVLAELPPDIRSRLAKHIKATAPVRTAAPIRQTSPSAKPISYTALPSHSQLDREALEALPEEIRAEIIAHYEMPPTKALRGAQAILPQSPRKNRTVAISKKGSATRGRPRGGGGNTFLSRLKGARSNGSTLTQSNFVATTHSNRATSHDITDSDVGNDEAEANKVNISDEFLNALPQDIRKEVLAQHRAEQLKRTGGLEVIRKRNALRSKQQQQKQAEPGEQRNGERVLLLPARAPRPCFTSRRLTALPDLRSAVSEWYDAFRDEGPYAEDVVALGKYLENVVTDEGDMNKAIAVVKWIAWVVDGGAGGDVGDGEEKLGDAFRSAAASTQASMKWSEALETAKEHVKEAVKARGLGPVAF